MAREKRIESSFQSDNGTFYRIEIYDNDADSASVLTPNVSGKGFELTYQSEDEDRFTGLIPSELKIEFLLETDAQAIFVNKIRQSIYGDIDVGVYRSTDDVSYSLFWTGVLLNDISPIEDISYPRKAKLTAVCGLSTLKNIDFNKDTGYATPSSFQTISYFQNILTNQIPTADNYWGANDLYIQTYVDWTYDEMEVGGVSVSYRDPLNTTRFNFMAFVEIEDSGAKKYKDSFFLLDSICKTFGMRCFQSGGVWQLVQVNNYYEWTSPDTHFFRSYKKTGVNPYANGSTSANFIEGSNILRYGGSFDFLPIVKKVEANYNHLTPFDLPFFYYINDYPTSSTQLETFSNEIAIWNGFRFNNNLYNNTSNPGAFDINRLSNNKLRIYLGNVTALTGSSIYFNRNLYLKGFDDGFIGSGVDNYVEANISLRFVLEGASDTNYSFIYNGEVGTWTDVDSHPLTATIGPHSVLPLQAGGVGVNGGSITISFQTNELPFDGDLFLECYAFCTYDNFQSALDITTPIVITEATTDSENVYVYSEPETNEEQGIKYLLDNEVTIKKFFRAFNSPGGTTINNGIDIEVPELFIGTGPTSGAVGRLETYDFSAGSWQDGMNDTWKAYSTGSGVEITQLLVEEILKGQALGARVFDGSLKIVDNSSNLQFLNGIDIDGTTFVPYNVTFVANEDTWNGEYYGVDLSTTSQSIITGSQSLTDHGIGISGQDITNVINLPSWLQ